LWANKYHRLKYKKYLFKRAPVNLRRRVFVLLGPHVASGTKKREEILCI
jgi:hypothetical protein